MECIQIPISKGQFAIIDAEDAELVSGNSWQANPDKNRGKFYAQRYVSVGPGLRQRQTMHRLIMGANEGEMVDHINQNTLDNRKSNLRIATRSQNGINRKPYKTNTSGKTGVIWYPPTKRWQVHITVQKKRMHLGYFVSFDEAVTVRKAAEAKYFGEFAYRE